jgi:hypothetical protein
MIGLPFYSSCSLQQDPAPLPPGPSPRPPGPRLPPAKKLIPLWDKDINPNDDLSPNLPEFSRSNFYTVKYFIIYNLCIVKYTDVLLPRQCKKTNMLHLSYKYCTSTASYTVKDRYSSLHTVNI